MFPDREEVVSEGETLVHWQAYARARKARYSVFVSDWVDCGCLVRVCVLDWRGHRWASVVVRTVFEAVLCLLRSLRPSRCL